MNCKYIFSQPPIFAKKFMQVVVSATNDQWNELTDSKTDVDWVRVNDAGLFVQYDNADAFFSLKDETILPTFEALQKPIFINSVVHTLADLKAGSNIYRINGWSGFLNRSVWEISGVVDEHITSILKSLDIKINKVQDEPGFITARIIAMIINEAYFAVEDKVSTKMEINTAMKLGTNYPYGPFEWAEMIGPENIEALLKKLNLTDSRYKPAGLLSKEVKENK